MKYENIELEGGEGSFSIVLNRPPLNILNAAMMREIRAAMEEILKSQPSAGLIFLRAKGKAFSAGADVKEHLPEHVKEMMDCFHDIFHALDSFEGVVVSCVQGPALGGGCELALFSDIVLASCEAGFGQPEIKLGVFPPIALVLFPMILPSRIATELILTGESLSAEEAHRLGIVNKVFEAGGFDAGVEEYRKRLKGLSLSSLRIAKRAMRKIHPVDFKEKLQVAEKIYLDQLMRTKDAQEGCLAFLERRKPVWSHS